jgi:hypothetical protein
MERREDEAEEIFKTIKKENIKTDVGLKNLKS